MYNGISVNLSQIISQQFYNMLLIIFNLYDFY